jgi:hypothetical protein
LNTPALAAPQRFGALGVAVLAGRDDDVVAPLGVVTARHVRDQDRFVPTEEDHHLLWQVDLGVAVGRLGSTGFDDDAVLHPRPHPLRDDARGLGGVDAEHELLEPPHGSAGALAEVAVDRTGVERQLLQTALHLGDVAAVHPEPHGIVEPRLAARSDRVDRDRCHRPSLRGRAATCGIGGRRGAAFAVVSGPTAGNSGNHDSTHERDGGDAGEPGARGR